jgi:hypothetical protein
MSHRRELIKENAITEGDLKGMRKGMKLGQKPIKVTQEIIETAIPTESGHCMVSDGVRPVAMLAGMRIGKSKNAILTDIQTIRLTDLNTRIRYIWFTPRWVAERILQFDKGVKPEPFTFRLGRPVQIIAPIVKTDGEPKPKRKLYLNTAKNGHTHRPVRIGRPEMAKMLGVRREFGLRAVGVWKSPDVAAAPAQ